MPGIMPRATFEHSHLEMSMKPAPVCLGSILVVLALAACSAAAAAVPGPTTAPSPLSETPSSTRTVLAPTQAASRTPAATRTPIPEVALQAVGDIMLGRTVGDQVLAKGAPVVFAGVRAILDQADVLVGNLECAITAGDQSQSKSFTLKAPPETAQALGMAGFDVLSLANNHALDFGAAGLADTQAALHQYGIQTVGAGMDAASAHAPLLVERNGLRLAFLGYADVMPENSGFDARTWIAGPATPGLAWADLDQIKADVSAAKRQADLVIVLLHSGYELNSTVSFDQRKQAQTAIDAGAVLVIGSHPHILQSIERYHGGLIAYSLGNFVFDQYKGVLNATVILRVLLDRSGLVRYDYVPVVIENGLPMTTSIDNLRGVETLVAPPQP